MELPDVQQQRVLQILRQSGTEPVSIAELRADGIDFPAAVISELELNGYAIDRVYEEGRLRGVRLHDPSALDVAASRRRQWWRPRR